jgi:hypothetical protein
VRVTTFVLYDLSKAPRQLRKSVNTDTGVQEGTVLDGNATGSLGYGLKLTFDLSVGKASGMLKVRACWYDIVFRNEFGFTESRFLY